jgi:hypothetical protein
MEETDHMWYRELRRSELQLAEEEALEFVGANCCGVLALSSEEGLPYAVPMTYGLENRTIYIHSAGEGQKLELVRQNPHAVFVVYETGSVVPGETPCAASLDYTSVLLFGRVRQCQAAEEKKKGLEVVCRSTGISMPEDGTPEAEGFASNVEQTTVLALEIEHVSGKGRQAE